jgi:cytochrome b pre-mRNA-processing protein 3
MLSWLTQRPDYSATAARIYGSIVASARQITFYDPWGVPDTREGRYEMLALHVAIVMLRLGRIKDQGEPLSRSLAETFMADMDDNMREMGIGDLAVPKKIKRAAAALFDRHRDYGAALTAGDERALAHAIADALSGAISGAAADNPQPVTVAALDSAALAGYAGRLAGALAVTSDADCLAGSLPLPWPPQ